MHATMVLSLYPDRPMRVSEVAGRLEVSEAHLGKVFQRLAKADLVKSRRGPRGGFFLTRPAEDVTLLEIYEAVDGPISKSCCLLDPQKCRLPGCLLAELISRLQKDVRGYLGSKTLADACSDDHDSDLPL